MENPITTIGDRIATVDDDTLQRAGRVVLGVLLVGLLVLPLAVSSSGIIRLVLLALIFAGYATAWNLFSGYSGYISFGHAIFFGTGAFVSTILLVEFGITPWIGMFVGGFGAVLAALVIGTVTFRADLSGIYFALAVLAFPLIVAPIIIWYGYIEVSVPFTPDQAYLMMSFRGLTEYYYIAYVLLVFTLAVTWWVQRTRLGFYLQAIKSSEEAAESLGVNTYRYKLYALSLSAFLSGLFGTIYVQVNFIFFTQGIFGLTLSAQPVILAVAGGLGTLYGPLVAGLTLFPLAEYLRSTFGSTIPGIHNILYGIVLILIIIYLPDGIYAGLRNRLISQGTAADREPDDPEKPEDIADPTTDPTSTLEEDE